MPHRNLWPAHQGWKRESSSSKTQDGGLSFIHRLLGFQRSPRRRRLHQNYPTTAPQRTHDCPMSAPPSGERARAAAWSLGGEGTCRCLELALSIAHGSQMDLQSALWRQESHSFEGLHLCSSPPPTSTEVVHSCLSFRTRDIRRKSPSPPPPLPTVCMRLARARRRRLQIPSAQLF